MRADPLGTLKSNKTQSTTASVNAFINKQSKREAMRSRMTEMAILSEVAIEKGDVMAVEEAMKRARSALKRIAVSRSQEKREKHARMI